LKILNLNAQSLNSHVKKDQLHAILDQVKPDIVVATETWLSSEVLSSEIIPLELNYEIYRRDRGSRGGGVLVLVSNKFLSSRVDQYETNCEIVWVKVELQGSKPLLISGYYKPKESDEFSQNEFSRSLHLVNQTKNHIWVLGDFNMPGFTWPNNTPCLKADCRFPTLYSNFTDILDDHSLTQMVTEPTRYDNILDLFLTNNPTLVSKVSILPGIADHDMIYAEVSIRPKLNKQVPRSMHVYRRADWESLKRHMSDFKDSFLSTCEGRSVNQLWIEFRDTLLKGIDKFVPTKTLSSKPSLPWLTQDIKRSMRKRDSLYQKHKRSGIDKDRQDFIEARHRVKSMLKVAHDRYIEDILNLASHEDIDEGANKTKTTFSSKKLFSLLKSTKRDSSGIAPLLKDGELFSSSGDKANILNSQFNSVFTPKQPLSLSQLATMAIDSFPVLGLNSDLPAQYKQAAAHPDMDSITISTNGILKLLKDLNPNKAAGPDHIKPLVLRELRDVIAPVLQVLFQKSLDSGEVPEDWSRASVCPLFKKGDKSDASNYRPISLTCILCKVLEHIVATNIVSHLDRDNVLYNLQHGFRSKRSCETQLVSLIEDIHRNGTEGRQTDLILLDFSKAFDKVNHEKLLFKLHQYGIRGLTLQWIRAFLSNRSQVVIVENDHSGTIPVTSGVPQGSVLGPILFLIYINDLPDDISAKVRLFADDTAAYLAVSSLHDASVLQRDMDKLQLWERSWDMEFNPSKCTVLHITRAKTPVPSTYTLHGQQLASVKDAKYLGVTLSGDLSWSNHIQRVSTAANRALGFLKRNIRTQNPAIRQTAYKAMVRPILEYASPAWSPHNQTHVDRLEKTQRRAARWTMSNYSREASVTEMLSQLGWRTLNDRRSDARLCLFYKIVHGLVAVPMPAYICHPTRMSRLQHPLSFRQLHCRIDSYKFSFFPLVIVQWNSLPAAIATLPTLAAFKHAVGTISYP